MNKKSYRTDLAIELETDKNSNFEERKNGDILVSKINISSENEMNYYGKNKGNYITLCFPDTEKMLDTEPLEEEIINALSLLFPEKREKILIVGLGNTEITADSIGPITVSKILATRHIAGKFAEDLGLKGLKSVSIIAPSVLGKTGIESAELIKAVSDKIKPDAVIIIDALAAGSLTRLFKTVQLSDSGISPGSGVKNKREEISKKTLGIPVVAIGVPTVVDMGAIADEIGGKSEFEMVLTPKDIDILSQKTSELLAHAINVFVQPDIEKEIILSLA